MEATPEPSALDQEYYLTTAAPDMSRVTNENVIEVLKLLSHSKCLTDLNLDRCYCFGSNEVCQLLGKLVQNNKTLRKLSMLNCGPSKSALEYVVKGLLESTTTTLHSLTITCSLESKGPELVTELIERGLQHLHTLHLRDLPSRALDLVPMSEALARNISLREIEFRVEMSSEVGDYLNGQTQSGHRSLSSETRSFPYGFFYPKDAGNLSEMLRKNTTLKSLTCCEFEFPQKEWKRVFKSLHSNKTLLHLGLPSCGGLGDSLEDLTELLQVNMTLKQIKLVATDLEYEGRDVQVMEMLNRNARLERYYGTLKKKLTFVSPRIGRLFLCGSARAGKTTLRRSMTGSKGIWKKMNKKWRGVMDKRTLNKRTQGIEIRLLESASGQQIAIWDMAGQHEYHALHDSHYLFPDINQACVFLFLYKPVFDSDGSWNVDDSKVQLEEQLHYWLSFINSNSKKSGWALPEVSVVLTHLDRLVQRASGRNPHDIAVDYEKWAAWTVIDNLRTRFKGRLELNEKVFAINALSTDDGRRVVDHVFKSFDDLFHRRLPLVPAACEEMNTVLAKWTNHNPYRPIIKSDDLYQLCSDEVDALKDLFDPEKQPDVLDLPTEEHKDAAAMYVTQNQGSEQNTDDLCELCADCWHDLYDYENEPDVLRLPIEEHKSVAATCVEQNQRAVISYLHDVGSIIHFQEAGFVVVNPNWLGKVFLGQLLRPGDDESYQPIVGKSKNGLVLKAALESLLTGFIEKRKYTGFKAENLILLLKELELCSEVEDGESTYYFIPSTLQDLHNAADGRRRLQWTVSPLKGDGYSCSGVRLQCTDRATTFLSPGFFQRFQNYLHDVKLEGISINGKYEMERNLIRLKYDGEETLVESSGEDGDFVDILTRSKHTHAVRARNNLQTALVKQLRKFCASPKGCPGVALEEAFLRPACVEKLTLSYYRKHQAVAKASLEQEFVAKLFERTGPEVWKDTSYVRSLISGTGIYRHRFEAVNDPETPLEEEWVDAIDMLHFNGIMHAIHKYRSQVLQQKHTIYQTADTLRALPGQPGNDRASSSGPDQPDGREDWTKRIHDYKEMQTRVEKDDNIGNKIDAIGRIIVRGFEDLYLNIDETRYQLIQMLSASITDVQNLHEALMDKIDEVMGIASQLHELPRMPYFCENNVGLFHRLVAFTQIAKPMKLHFMCENPSKPHAVENQNGLPLSLEKDGDLYVKLRPLIVGSIKLLFILTKAGLHITAGIGNVIPDFQTASEVIPLKAGTLFGEELLSAVEKMVKDLPESTSSENQAKAWACVQEIVGPLMARGEIPKYFHLYKVHYRSNRPSFLSRSGQNSKMRRKSFWVCKSCKEIAENAGLLQVFD